MSRFSFEINEGESVVDAPPRLPQVFSFEINEGERGESKPPNIHTYIHAWRAHAHTYICFGWLPRLPKLPSIEIVDEIGGVRGERKFRSAPHSPRRRISGNSAIFEAGISDIPFMNIIGCHAS
jgi:hypothetical protein